jgi:hypothetical protein
MGSGTPGKWVRGNITKILFSDGKRKRKIGAGHPPFFRKRRPKTHAVNQYA